MKSKRRLTKVILLLLSGVSLSSILVLAGIWIVGEISESARQERQTAERFERDWQELLSSEVQRITLYMSEASAENQLSTLISVKGKTDELVSALEGAMEEDPGIVADPAKRGALAAFLRHGAFEEGRERFVLISLSTGELLSGAPPEDGAPEGGAGSEVSEAGSGESGSPAPYGHPSASAEEASASAVPASTSPEDASASPEAVAASADPASAPSGAFSDSADPASAHEELVAASADHASVASVPASGSVATISFSADAPSASADPDSGAEDGFSQVGGDGEDGFRRVVESVKALGGAFYSWDFLGDEGDGEPLTFLEVSEPLGWAVGVSIYPEVFVREQERDVIAWAEARTLPPGMGFALLSYEGELLAGDVHGISGNVFDSDGGTGFARAASAVIRGARAVGWDFEFFKLTDPMTGEESRLLACYRAVPGKDWVAVGWVSRAILDRGLADERHELSRRVNRNILRTGLTTLFALLAVIAISRVIERKASRIFASFFQFFERASSSSVLLNPDEQPFLEFAHLAEAANRMIEVRGRAEEMLRVNEARFRTIFEVSPQAVCVLDDKGALLEANSHFPAVTGIPLAEALGRPLSELMGPGAAEAFQEAADGAAQALARDRAGDDGTQAAAVGRELEFTRPDGRSATLLFLGAPLKLTAEDRILGIFIDVTGQRAAEREKALLRDRLGRAQTMETLGVMASETAHELNNILSGITGYPELLLKGGGLSDVQRAYVSEIQSAGRRAAEVVGDLLTLSQGVAVKRETVDLNVIVKEVLSDPATLAAPTGPGRSAAVAALKQAGAAVLPLTEAALAHRDASGAGSEATPDAGSTSAPASTSPEAAPVSSSPEAAPAATASEATASEASGEIISSGPLTGRPVPETGLCASPVWIEAGRMRLKKTVQALVSNAVNAAALSPEGRRRVKVETSVAALDSLPGLPSGNGPADYAVLKVTDSGPGIPEGDRARILEPFYTGRRWGGRGLGLTVAANTIQGLGGALEFVTGDEGTAFTAFFPAATAPAKSAKPRRSAGAPASLKAFMGSGEKVLVVDDVDIQRKLAGRMLQNLGYDAATAASGEEAVEYLKGKDADVLLLDMIMRPGINGRETYERILAFKPGQRAVIASGMAEGEEVEKARALGASHFIMKPYTIEELAKALKQALGVRTAPGSEGAPEASPAMEPPAPEGAPPAGDAS
ncbi:MAG: response regulator [Deltaproteobacteria bacterium]|jgi:PAS domain S-box-containing protein|nr:response regulator [Deltaproteobacteria bacterium]